MKELIEYIARSLVTNPEAVTVTETVEADQIILRLEVAPEDKGKVIGRQGRVAQAMRVLPAGGGGQGRRPGHAGNRLTGCAAGRQPTAAGIRRPRGRGADSGQPRQRRVGAGKNPQRCPPSF